MRCSFNHTVTELFPQFHFMLLLCADVALLSITNGARTSVTLLMLNHCPSHPVQMDCAAGLVSGHSQREKKRSYKDFTRDEEELEEPHSDFEECSAKRLYKVDYTGSQRNVVEIDQSLLSFKSINNCDQGCDK